MKYPGCAYVVAGNRFCRRWPAYIGVDGRHYCGGHARRVGIRERLLRPRWELERDTMRGDEGHCRSCGAPVMWTVTAKGKRMPVDRDTGISHFATCPQSKTWRKSR